jgi:diguanylate cyclase (GGDEF)-like protein
MGAEASLLAAERMRALVEAEPIRAAGCEEPIALTVCFGAATAPGSVSLSLDELLGRADDAAYRAKRLGRNRVCAEQARG